MKSQYLKQIKWSKTKFYFSIYYMISSAYSQMPLELLNRSENRRGDAGCSYLVNKKNLEINKYFIDEKSWKTFWSAKIFRIENIFGHFSKIRHFSKTGPTFFENRKFPREFLVIIFDFSKILKFFGKCSKFSRSKF